MAARIRTHIRSNVIGYLALFFALTGGVAWATHPGGANTISSADIINGEVRNADLGADVVASGKIDDRHVKNADLSIGASSSNTIADGGIQGVDVKNDPLTGTQVDESTLNGGGDLSGALSSLQIGPGAVGPNETGAVPAVRAEFPADQDGTGCLFTFGSQKGNNTASGVPEALPFEAEAFDTGDMHVAGSNCQDPNRSRLTAAQRDLFDQRGGSLGAERNRHAMPRDQQARRVREHCVAGDERATNDGAGAHSTLQSVSTLEPLNQGDSVTAEVNQTSGGSLHAPLVAADRRSYFSAIWLAPAP